jgi:hypothetical protein
MHGNRGTVTIETANAKVSPKNRKNLSYDYVMIAVTDTGSGMTKKFWRSL